MHIAMNMLSLMALGKLLEVHFGTMWMMATTSWSILLTGSVEILLALVANPIYGHNNAFLKQHSLGFSAVLFHLVTIESYKSPESSRSIFGMMQVSSRAYPWVILLVTQIILPQASFTGHLSGILCGILQMRGYFNIIMPTTSFMRQCDDSQKLRFMNAKESYVRTASNDTFSIFSNSNSTIIHDVSEFARKVLTFIRNILETIKYMIFGRDGGGNDNISVTEEYVALNDKEWVGIPQVSSPQGPQESEMV